MLACSDFTSTASSATALPPPAEYIGGPALKLRFPRCDLIGVDVNLLRQLSQCSVALDGGKRHLRLESRGGVPACPSAHLLSCFVGQSCPPSGRESPYPLTPTPQPGSQCKNGRARRQRRPRTR